MANLRKFATAAQALAVLLALSGDAVRTVGEGDAETAPMDEGTIEEMQECVDAVRPANGPAGVKMIFVTTDGETIDSDKAAAGCFFYLAREAFASSEDDEEVQVDLASGSNEWSRVNSQILESMLSFGHAKLEKAAFKVDKVEFSRIARPVKNDLKEANVLPEDADFIDAIAEGGKLFSLATAAHYLDFPELYQLATAKIASMIWGKTAEEIQTTLTNQA